MDPECLLLISGLSYFQTTRGWEKIRNSKSAIVTIQLETRKSMYEFINKEKPKFRDINGP